MNIPMAIYPGAEQKPSPNHGGALGKYQYIVVHYTAGKDLDSSVEWLCNPAAKASAHLVIGRDGRIVQLVSLKNIAWANGESQWEGVHGLNNYALSIELDNMGPLQLVDGVYRSVACGAIVPPEDVFMGPHKNGGSFTRWQKYTDVQIETLKEVVHNLRTAWPSIKEVIGHDDIAPLRKSDPGPALATVMAELFKTDVQV